MGLELREIQSPIFRNRLILLFMSKPLPLLVGSSGSGKSSLFQMIAQVVLFPIAVKS